MDIRETFGAQVRVRRRELGLTQEEVAERAGVSTETISRVERGAYEASLTSAAAIADALGGSLDALLGRPKPAADDNDPELQKIISTLGPEARSSLLIFLRVMAHTSPK